MNMRKKLFINGEWIQAKQYSPLYSPYDGELLAEIPYADEEEVDMAIAAADKAKAELAKMPSHQRASILEKLVQLLEENEEKCTRLIANEAAKPWSTAKAEVARTITTYKFAAEEARRIHGETIPMDAAPGGENRIAYTVRKPVGVVAAITPFNFPMNLVAHKVGPAIAAGNTIVLKPAGQTPLTALFLAELLQQAGLPAGAFNVVTGSGTIVGEKLVKDERVKKITFTGSPSVGIGIRNKAGLKKVTLELGSNAALIVDKGVDLEAIIPKAVRGAYAFSGQVCISIQRIFVHEELYNGFVDEFIEQTKKLKLGSPLDPETEVSALISSKDVERSLSWIEEAVSAGATLATGGTRLDNILTPTVLLNVDPMAKVSCQEVFAPIVLINKVSSVSEAISLVNDSKYGLQAGIYTTNLNTAFQAAEELEVGGVMINDIPTFRVDHMPYGGVKESGVGREGVKYAIEEMTEMKLVCFNKTI
jgi:acyl-CoA reductase-like NAD-dependent aldehyde dehydrogenase